MWPFPQLSNHPSEDALLHCPRRPHPGLVGSSRPACGRLTGTASYHSRTFLRPLRRGHTPLREVSQSPASHGLPSTSSPFPASSPHRQPQPSPPFRTRSGSDAQQPCVRRGLDLRQRSRPRPAHNAVSSRPRVRVRACPAHRPAAPAHSAPLPPFSPSPRAAGACRELRGAACGRTGGRGAGTSPRACARLEVSGKEARP